MISRLAARSESPLILRGSVQRNLDTVRISAELNRVSDGVVR